MINKLVYIAAVILIIMMYFIVRFINNMFLVKEQPSDINDDNYIQTTIPKDFVLIVSSNSCGFCKQLHNKLKDKKIKKTKIVATIEGGKIEYDDAISNISPEQRKLIEAATNEVKNGKRLAFPTLIVNNEKMLGIPPDPILKNIFRY